MQEVKKRITVTFSDGRVMARDIPLDAIVQVRTEGEWLSLVVGNPRPVWALMALRADYEKTLIDGNGNTLDEYRADGSPA